MVKLYHLSILYKDSGKAVSLCSTSDLTSFGFFQRNSVQEFMNFSSQILVERSQPATRTSVKEQSYMCHVYVRSDKIAGALISDHEYPHRVAHTLLNQVLDDFAAKVPASSWTGEANSVTFPGIEGYLLKYQQIAVLMRINRWTALSWPTWIIYITSTITFPAPFYCYLHFSKTYLIYYILMFALSIVCQLPLLEDKILISFTNKKMLFYFLSTSIKMSSFSHFINYKCRVINIYSEAK